MRGLKTLLLAFPLALATTVLADAHDASACGG